MTEIVAMINGGDARSAIPLLEATLEREPNNVDALSNLACCLEETGNSLRAGELLERACRLDDTHLAASLNYARHLSSVYRSAEAIERLKLARVYLPSNPSIDSALATIVLNRGDPQSATRLARRAWLALPEILRAANCQLFHRAYDDVEEASVASEHLFWADTLPPLPPLDPTKSPRSTPEVNFTISPKQAGKRRIAYWSPDLRDHSVRYFFRPLLENHDRDRFEVVVYHDSPKKDAQTDLIRQSADHFYDVTPLPDPQLRALMASHDLDVLIELAGHTGENRIRLLAGRYATLQVSALGYPPTTGLASIDCKILDEHVVTPDASRYYTERPIALPGSFWCFDPLEEIPITLEPPAARNGYVTFGVIGNAAKTNPRIFRAWREILKRVERSRLLVRSIGFADADALEHYRHLLELNGLPTDRIDLVQPLRTGRELLGAYRDIDIVLDTFPFNGGTTTCFAIHMGVPVVSRSGASLLSRMGLSVLSNVGLHHWACSNDESYVDRAVTAAADIDFLRRFRSDVRERLRRSPLGNGKLYARHFEHAIEEALTERLLGNWRYRHAVIPLPDQEMVERARGARQRGQAAFSERMVSCCLRHYPQSGPAHLLKAELLSDAGNLGEACAYRERHRSSMSHAEWRSALLSSATDALAASEIDDARRYLTALSQEQGTLDHGEALHASLIRAAIDAPGSLPSPSLSSPITARETPVRFAVLVPCSGTSEFDRVRADLLQCSEGVNKYDIRFIRCDERLRAPAYRAAMEDCTNDILVIAQKNLSFANPSLFAEIAVCLDTADGLSFAGASTDNPIDWRTSSRTQRAGCLILSPDLQSAPRRANHEVQLLGLMGLQTFTTGMTVLEGSFLALRRETAALTGQSALDPLLESSGGLMEEFLTSEMAKGGAQLGAHHSLGIVWSAATRLVDDHEFDARRHLAERSGVSVDLMADVEPDPFRVSVPARSAKHAFSIQRHLMM